ncbi:hypothetical protein N665_0589s0004 [Sinapis alba]|nr:hypothetical protein N665_0589s0004 [Sinapis alba]
MDVTKASVTIFFVLVLMNSFSSHCILAKPEIKKANYQCIVPCSSSYGNRICNNYCINHHFAGGQCDATRGGKLPQCCCYNYNYKNNTF